MRIAVTGLAASYPLGGAFWDYFQYVLGFRKLGHDVLYIEDTGKWCYDPAAQTFRENGAGNAEYLANQARRLDPELDGHWFYRDAAGRCYGVEWPRVADFCRSADLFVHISGSCFMREAYFAPARVILIDSDPVYTQASIAAAFADRSDPKARQRAAMVRRHHAFFTFGENIGSPDCRIPKTGPIEWIPTRQPIVLDCFAEAVVPQASRRRVFTTVASWEPAERAPIVAGVAYGGKSAEFERFMRAPSISPLPVEVAISGPAPIARLRDAGWRTVDGYAVSGDPWAYRGYLADSLGEFSVAKSAYVACRSGWFSGRSACYMALGVPVIVQDTGFGTAIPTGQGVFPFSTLEQGREAIDQVCAAPEHHGRAAREVVRGHFASDRVLGRLIEQAFASGAPSARAD